MPEGEAKMERVILLLSDEWSITQGGVAGVNRSLALSLSRYKGIRVVSTVFCGQEKLGKAEQEEADRNNITLISPTDTVDDMTQMVTRVNENPAQVYGTLSSEVPYVSHIVGHSPVTAEAARKLKEELYPDSKLILFYHVIPADVELQHQELPYVMPTDTELVHLAEKADVVYSVTDKLHWYYTAKFRNRASTQIDHRLFLPQCSQDVFEITRRVDDSWDSSDSNVKILVLTPGHGTESWAGLDIAACAVNKVVNVSVEGAQTRPAPSFIIGVPATADVRAVRDYAMKYANHPQLKLEVRQYDSPGDMYKDLSDCTLCLVPTRAEAYGYVGLHALSAGIPTLIAADSAIASTIKQVTSEPEYYLVGVTPSPQAVRQDGSVWRDRILEVLQDPQLAQLKADQLRMALRRSEPTKESHDNVVCSCLGGVRIKHEVTTVEFHYRKDEEKELPVVRQFNLLLTATMKQCWRLKHHPLTTENDLFQLMAGVDFPITELLEAVTNKIEEYDRRIVGVDENTGAFIVYCPSAYALTDLWAMCDVINQALTSILLSGEHGAIVLEKFKLHSVDVRTIITGPEYLQYKEDILKNMRSSKGECAA